MICYNILVNFISQVSLQSCSFLVWLLSGIYLSWLPLIAHGLETMESSQGFGKDLVQLVGMLT